MTLPFIKVPKLYTSTETTFPHERYRIQLALIMQLAGITGNRPSALLAVRYQHIKVTLLEDPNGGEQPRVLIEIVFNHTKGYLGEKDAYVFKSYITFAVISRCVAIANNRGRRNFGIPDVPNEPCLLLCPHITMLALLFADQADFTRAVVLSSDCPWAEAVTSASKGGDGRKTTIPALEKRRKRRTNFRGSSS